MLSRILAATVAGGVAFFVLGFLVFGVLLDPITRPHLNVYPGLINEVPVFAPLILASFVSAFLLAYIFDRWAGIRTFVGGLKGGAIIWFIIALYFQLMFLAFMNLAKDWIPPMADVLGSTLIGALAGGVVGLVLGAMNKKTGD